MKEIRIEQTDADRAALEKCKQDGMFDGIGDPDEDFSRGVVPKPWGHEWQVTLTQKQAVWKLHINPAGETSMHAHPNKETILIVSDGEIEFSTLDATHTLGTGSIVRIGRGVFHKSYSQLGAGLIEIEWPPKKNDLVRMDDKYGRKGKGYTR